MGSPKRMAYHVISHETRAAKIPNELRQKEKTMRKYTAVSISARRYEDSNNCLTDAARDYVAEHGLDEHGFDGTELEARWEDDERNNILLTVPSWAVL